MTINKHVLSLPDSENSMSTAPIERTVTWSSRSNACPGRISLIRNSNMPFSGSYFDKRWLNNTRSQRILKLCFGYNQHQDAASEKFQSNVAYSLVRIQVPDLYQLTEARWRNSELLFRKGKCSLFPTRLTMYDSLPVEKLQYSKIAVEIEDGIKITRKPKMIILMWNPVKIGLEFCVVAIANIKEHLS